MRESIKKFQAIYFAVAFIILLYPSTTCGGNQDDPFDPFADDTAATQDPAESDGTAGTSPVPQTDLDDEEILVIESLRQSNPTSPFELAQSVQILLNMRLYREAKTYLLRLQQASVSDRQTLELMSKMGPDFFLEVRSQPELQPEGAEYAMGAFKASSRAANSPDRIADLIQQVSDEDRFVRAEAIRNLRRIGSAAAAAMLNQCADKKNKKQTPYIMSALKQMGKPALLPMLGAVRNDGTIPQAVAVSVLANINSPIATDALCRPAISSKVPASVRAIAAAAVAKQKLRNSGDIQRHIVERSRLYLAGKTNLPTDSLGQSIVWNWDFSKNRIVSVKVSRVVAAKLLAVDLARDAYRLDESNPAVRQLQILTVLEATKRIIGPNREMVPGELKRYVSNCTTADLDSALGSAIEENLVAAATGACELLGQMGDSALLASTHTSHRNLVDAVLQGNRHLQFAAAQAIARIDPQSPYPGSSYVAKLMTFLSQSNHSNSGIVADQRPFVAQRLASFVGQSGLNARVTFSPQYLVKELNSNPDIELIIITDSFSTPQFEELVQQVRKNWLTRQLPIGLFVSTNERQRDAQLLLSNDPQTMVFRKTDDPILIYGQIQKLLQLGQPWRVSNTQRDLQSEAAIRWINRVIEKPENYSFYHLASYRDQLARLLTTADNWELKSNIIGNLGTPDSQRELINLASQADLPVSEREIAAKAFNRSVQRSGILLTTSEIREQYDRYNASRTQAAESQNILSSLLDTIESRRR